MTAPHVPVVLVTGASRGLGRGIALAAAAEGLSVAVNYASNRAAAEETAAACRAVAPDARQAFVPVGGDIGRSEDRAAIVEGTLAALGRIDALVNNAGIAPRVRADITQASEASFDEVLGTNLKGPYFLTQRVVRDWLAGAYAPRLPGGFKVVFVTSISAETASVSRGEYCVSKAGLAMAAKLWATRLAGEGIQVVEVRPGIMATDMTTAVKEKYDSLIADGLIPQKRWGTPDDIGKAVRAILAGWLPYTTGTVVHVDGGFDLKRL